MKKLYTFYWDDGQKEEPLQASSEKQALWHLINRYQRKNPNFNKFIILNAFRSGSLNYKLGEPYKPVPKPNVQKQKSNKSVPEQLGLFKDYINRNK